MKTISRIASLLLLSAVSPVFGWDVPGHIIVAEIARENTTLNARKKMDELGPLLTFDIIQNGHITHHVYNGVNLAAWPDNVKHAFKNQTPFAKHFGDWHFVDIGLDADDPNPLTDPPKLSVKSGDAIQGLTLCMAVLTGKAKSNLVPNEAVALALLCHLVGDIHQPLHCATHYPDSGTDADKVYF